MPLLVRAGRLTRRAYWANECRPGNPQHNMDTDTALLQDVCQGRLSLPIIRIYEWDRPSVSIGRLQSEEGVRRLYPNLSCVRRPTGGRAVIHGDDLTVTVALRSAWLPGDLGKTVLSSYHLLMHGIVRGLTQAGHTVRYGSDKSRASREIIRCFDHAAHCDLMDGVSGRKLVGSAQRREGNSILQQMSLPLSLLPDKTAFLDAMRQGFQQSLEIEQWLIVDTESTACYTIGEESEGSRYGPQNFNL